MNKNRHISKPVMRITKCILYLPFIWFFYVYYKQPSDEHYIQDQEIFIEKVIEYTSFIDFYKHVPVILINVYRLEIFKQNKKHYKMCYLI